MFPFYCILVSSFLNFGFLSRCKAVVSRLRSSAIVVLACIFFTGTVRFPKNFSIFSFSFLSNHVQVASSSLVRHILIAELGDCFSRVHFGYRHNPFPFYFFYQVTWRLQAGF